MQVLKDSKVKFVSAVGVSLLTSGSVFGLLTAQVFLFDTCGGGKYFLLTLNLPSRFCCFLPGCYRKGGRAVMLGSIFFLFFPFISPFLCFLEDGALV